jgi:hypothetical protein
VFVVVIVFYIVFSIIGASFVSLKHRVRLIFCCGGPLLSSEEYVFVFFILNHLGAGPLAVHILWSLALTHPLGLSLQSVSASNRLDLEELGEIIGEEVKHAIDHLDLNAALGNDFLSFLDLLDVVRFEEAKGPLLADVLEVSETVDARLKHAHEFADEDGELLDALLLVTELLMLAWSRERVETRRLHVGRSARTRLWHP